MAKTLKVGFVTDNLGRDIVRGIIIAVAMEVLRHYLKPKDTTIAAVDTVLGVNTRD